MFVYHNKKKGGHDNNKEDCIIYLFIFIYKEVYFLNVNVSKLNEVIYLFFVFCLLLCSSLFFILYVYIFTYLEDHQNNNNIIFQVGSTAQVLFRQI